MCDVALQEVSFRYHNTTVLDSITFSIPAGEFVARHEAPRGQLVFKVVTDGGMNNKRVSIHVPTFRNAPTLRTMLIGNTVADAGLIVASIDPCFSCMDC